MTDLGILILLTTLVTGILYLVGDFRRMAAKAAAEAAAHKAERERMRQLHRPPEGRVYQGRADFIPYEFRQAA